MEKKNILLSLIVVGALGLRWVGWNDTPFINDEPALQLLVDRYFQLKQIPTVGLLGSQPIPYGPVPLWIYGILHVVTTHHWSLVALQVVFQTGAMALLFKMMQERWGTRISLLAILPAVTSPFLFFYSRLPWDNVFLISWSVLLLFFFEKLYFKKIEDKRVWIALGGVAGLALGTHLMVLPFLLTIAFILGVSCFRERRWGGVWGLMAFIGVVAPYGFAVGSLWGTAGDLTFGKPWLSVFRSSGALWRVTQFVSLEDFVASVLGPAAVDWRKSLGWGQIFLPLLSGLTFVFRVAVILFPVALVLFARKMRLSGTSRKILLFCGLVCLMTGWVYVLKGLSKEPHYYHYLAWIPTLFLGASIHFLKSKPQWVLRGCISLIVSVAIFNLFYLTSILSFVAKNGGTRSLTYSTSSGILQRVVRQICRTAGEKGIAQVGIDRRSVAVLPMALHYFWNREPECTGVHGDWSAIDVPAARIPIFHLNYPRSSASSADLVVTF